MRNIDVMLSRPGIYAVNTANSFALVEVTDEGICHQLELRTGTYQRDGVLRPGKWAISEIIALDGPFARTAHTALREVA